MPGMGNWNLEFTNSKRRFYIIILYFIVQIIIVVSSKRLSFNESMFQNLELSVPSNEVLIDRFVNLKVCYASYTY